MSLDAVVRFFRTTKKPRKNKTTTTTATAAGITTAAMVVPSSRLVTTGPSVTSSTTDQHWAQLLVTSMTLSFYDLQIVAFLFADFTDYIISDFISIG